MASRPLTARVESALQSDLDEMASHNERGSWASSSVLPAEETTEFTEAGNFPKSASLTAHKSLPRRRIVTEYPKLSRSDVSEVGHSGQKSFPPHDLSKQIHSWIPEPPRMQSGVTQSLPLTPPSLTRDVEIENSPGSSTMAKHEPPIGYSSIGSGLSTPINQRSPPTPDITPPRRRIRSDNLTPPQIHRFPLSRAESFRTAREYLTSSSQEGGIHLSYSAELASDPKLLDNITRDHSREIGLGLDLEPDRDKRASIHTSHLDSFDGVWGSSKDELNETSSSATELGPQHSVSLAKKIHKTSYNLDHGLRESQINLEEPSSTLRRGPSLRERVQKSRHSPPTASTERFAEQIEWPLQEGIDIEFKMRQIDNRRHSQMSASSTIIEAMVVDTPLRHQRTLRRTSKNISLRTASSLEKSSQRSSSDLDEQPHRLVHRNERLADRGNRSSTVSDGAINMKSGAVSSLRQSFPAAGIPQRRSSLKASSKKGHLKTTSLISSPRYSSRPATAPEAASDKQDFSPSKLRTAPGSNNSSTASKSKNTGVLPPTIPTRSSSLSAPTSRNVSRTTSLTSTSLHVHNLQNELQNSQPPQPMFQLTPDTDNPSVSPEALNSDDFASLRPRSRLVTPFSVVSMQSSTPGTLEVSEATAVNIYPHNNRSILVVQQMARRDSQQGPATVATVVEKVDIALTEPQSPPLSHRPKQLVDSPLQHPREPPKPPALSIIPPTPIPPLGPPTVEAPSKLDRPLSMIKRALSRRRYSESFISPLTRSLSKRHTFTGRRQTLSDDRTNGKLSPFWRPRGFWDDLSDSESDFGNDGPLFRTASYQQTSSNHQPPKLSSTFSRRLGSLHLNRRLSIAAPRAYSLRRHRSSGVSEHSYQFVQADREDGDDASMPRLGYQVRFVGLANIKNGLEKRKMRKEESRREKERVRLRNSIGISIVQPDARIA